MKEERLQKLLNGLAKATEEPVRPGLAEDIKDQIPHRFEDKQINRSGGDNYNLDSVCEPP